MDQRIERLVTELAAGRLSTTEAMHALRDLPGEDLGFARLDHHRSLRMGMPEVVFGEGKTPEQISTIVSRLCRHQQPVLVTRLSPEQRLSCGSELDHGDYDELSRTWLWKPNKPADASHNADDTDSDGDGGGGGGTVAVVCAGTSDLPVAEEAARTVEAFGGSVDRLVDVGVAGLHRLMGELPRLRAAQVAIVVAGMEGALPSVVGGLVHCPIIAVPTSVGYGASFGGVAALLSMLNSCASGITVVNIDNGFGAACAATRILQSQPAPQDAEP